MRKWMPLVAIGLGTFMLLIDVTIVNVALPDIAKDLKTDLGDLQWVIDIYALALAALLLGVGSAADRFGRRAVYIVGLIVFALSSLACALAPGAETLIAARAVQGVGGAAMFATTLSLLNTEYTGRDRGIAFGVWGAINGAAAAAGPILGGLLTANFGWGSIFLVNLPLSVVAVVLAGRVLHESRDPSARIDLPGVVTFTVVAGSLTYGLIRAAEDGWTEPAAVVSYLVAAVMLVVFVLLERARAYPMLDLRLFARPAFTGLMLAGTAIMAAAFGAMAYTSIWLQSVLGLGAIAAGAVFLPLSLVSLVCSIVAGRVLHDRFHAGTVIGVGLLFVGGGSALLALVDADSSWAVLAPGLAVMGVGVGLVMPTLSSAALAAAPRERGGMAGGATTTFRQLGYVLGVAVLGAVFAAKVEDSIRGSVPDAHATAGLLTGGQAPVVTGRVPALRPVVEAAFADGLRWVYLIAAGIGLVGAVLSFALVRARKAPAEAPQEAVAVS